MTDLLTIAERQFSALPAAERQPHWRGALTRLDEARIGLENAQALWQAEYDRLPASAVPGTDEYDEPLAERNAQAWGYLCDWASHDHVLVQIARAAAIPGLGLAEPAPEHTRGHDGAPLPPRPPGHPQHRRPH